MRNTTSQVYMFSVLTDKFHAGNDIDFLVDFSTVSLQDYADNYFDFKFSPEDMLDREVDLLETKAIKNPYVLSSINGQKMQIYG